MNSVTIALSLAQLTPGVIRYFKDGTHLKNVSAILVDTAKYVTRRQSASAAFEAISTDPEMLTKFEEALMQRELQLENAAAEDRIEARERDTKLLELGTTNTRATVLAYAAMTLLSCALLGLFFIDIPERSRDLLIVLITLMAAKVSSVFDFEFGSSAGSKIKDKELKEDLKAIKY